MNTVLVVAAHPDDEALGCAGTIARFVDEGRTVHVALLADGIGSRHAHLSGDAVVVGPELERRHAAARRAADILGVASIEFGSLPDNRLDRVDLLDLARIVEALVARHQPDTILTHWPGDVNIDHRRLHEAVVIACRPQPDHSVKTILSFEVASSTEWQVNGAYPPFAPNWFVDISAQLARRQAALEAYAEEMRAWPHARSLEASLHRAKWRGATIGVDAAEAFVLGRHIA